MQLKGWIELRGIRLTTTEIENILTLNPISVNQFGGEFYIQWRNCRARDHFGIFPAGIPPGTIICDGVLEGKVHPNPPSMDLDRAITCAVRLRSEEGVVAMSGGIDSTLIATLAQREAVAVGTANSHDLKRASFVAKQLDIPCHFFTITEDDVEMVLPQVLKFIPNATLTDIGIAVTLYFIAQWASKQGYKRIITGQGADELFGGYARYLQSTTLTDDLQRDFEKLCLQITRDQAIAALFDTYFSFPYLDVRVVRAANSIPGSEKVVGNVRKKPLRRVAECYVPREIAMYEKKAMQYGSGVLHTIKLLARKNGYKNSMQGYLDYMRMANVDIKA